MKTKKFGKKLVLNKKTIVHFGNGELNAVKGGITGSPTCVPGACHYVTDPLKTCFTCPQTGNPCIACAYPID